VPVAADSQSSVRRAGLVPGDPDRMPLLHDLAPPQVTRAIPNDDEQPGGELVQGNGVGVAMQLEERLGGQVFGNVAPAGHRHRKPKDRREVAPVSALETIHLGYARRLENGTSGGLRH
jgi:hypothetical protein